MIYKQIIMHPNNPYFYKDKSDKHNKLLIDFLIAIVICLITLGSIYLYATY